MKTEKQPVGNEDSVLEGIIVNLNFALKIITSIPLDQIDKLDLSEEKKQALKVLIGKN